jgi:heme/copper-type cytochrome/quinol oxidase subunit 4
VALLFSPASVVWLLLMLATCASTWWLKSGAATSAVATAFIMLIAAFKVRLVIVHFMELGGAPWPWRLLFDGWIVVCTTVILFGFLGAA